MMLLLGVMFAFIQLDTVRRGLLLAQPNTGSSKLSALALILYNIQWMDWFVCALLCSDLTKIVSSTPPTPHNTERRYVRRCCC